MKLKYSFENVDMGNEFVSVPVGNGANNVHGVIKLNQEGLEILEMLKEDITEQQIVERLAEKYGNDWATLTKWVKKVIETLREAKLLEE